MGLVIILLDLYFLFYEIVVILRDGLWNYIATDVFNYIDVITALLNAALVVETFTETENPYSDRKSIKNLTALAIVLMWANLFDWFNLFSSYFSLYWRVIKTTLVEITSIAVIFVLLLMAFGNALIIMNEGRYKDEQLYQ